VQRTGEIQPVQVALGPAGRHVTPTVVQGRAEQIAEEVDDLPFHGLRVGRARAVDKRVTHVVDQLIEEWK
jgi:hypothetical protein